MCQKRNNDNIDKYIDDPNYLFRKGHIVWANIPENNGSIQSGERKVLIISNTVNNICSPNIHIIPLTTKNKHFKLHIKRNNARDYYCIEQLQLIDKKYIIEDRGFELPDETQFPIIDKYIDVQLGRAEL